MMRILVSVLVLLFLVVFCYCDSKLGIGVSYPGITLRYSYNRLSTEFRFQNEMGITAFGIRGIYFLMPTKKIIGFYVGVEYDKFFFDTYGIKGSGNIIYPLGGIEISPVRRLVVNFDLGFGWCNAASGIYTADDMVIPLQVQVLYYFLRW